MSKVPGGGSRIPIGPRLKQPTTSKSAFRRVIQDGKNIFTEKLLTSKLKPQQDVQKKDKQQVKDEATKETNITFKKPDPPVSSEDINISELNKVDRTFDITKLTTVQDVIGRKDAFEFTIAKRNEMKESSSGINKTVTLDSTTKPVNKTRVLTNDLKNIEIKLSQHIGCRVDIVCPNTDNFKKQGILRYVGHVQTDANIWCGVETNIPYINQHDGCIDGVKYFSCEFGHGTMVPLDRVFLSDSHDNRFENPNIQQIRSRIENLGPSHGSKHIHKTPNKLINDITHCLVDDGCGENSESGPYSLLVALNPPVRTPNTLNLTLDRDKIRFSGSFSASTPINDSVHCSKESENINCQSTLTGNSKYQTCVGNIDGESIIEFQSISIDSNNVTNDNDKSTLIQNVSAMSFISVDASANRISDNLKHVTTDTIELTSTNNVEPKEKYKVDILNYNLKFSSQMEENYKVDSNQKNSREAMKLDLLSPTTFSENSVRQLSGQNSFEESLGILTPDQMDSLSLLDNMRSPSVEDFNELICESRLADKTLSADSNTPSTEKSGSAVNTENEFMQNNIQLDPLHNKVCMSMEDTICDKNLAININVDENNLGNEENCALDSLLDLDAQLDSYDMFNDKPCKQSIAPNQFQINSSFTAQMNDEELLSSVRSSILDPLSFVVDTTVNMDLPLDSKKHDLLGDNNMLNRVDQTPSPEELPLDPIGKHGDFSGLTVEPLCDSTSQDSHTDSDMKSDMAKSMETSKVSNSFITSVTSITSLDGYQGDGEMSRPVSRGAEESPTIGHRVVMNPLQWQNIPINRRADPMTDSDFFTESDADGHDEHINRGDRRAQVIDGALYGGVNLNAAPQVIVSRNDDSCMESSGVYTDIENQRSSPVHVNAVVDLSPGGSTTSAQSDCSQNVAFNESLNITVKEIERPLNCALDSEKSISKCCSENYLPKMRNSPNDKQSKDEKNTALKKHKTQRKDVVSKVKTLIDASASKSESDQGRDGKSSKSPKKGNKWDAVMNKIAVSKSECKPRSYKEVKSKVTTLIGADRQRINQDGSGTPPKTTSPPKAKCRRVRSRLPEASVTSGKSSPHSSQSDVSVSGVTIPKQSLNKHSIARLAKKRDVAPGAIAASPLNDAGVRTTSPACAGDATPPLSLRPQTAPAAAPPVRPNTLKKGSGLPALNGSPTSIGAGRTGIQRQKPVSRTTSLSPRLQQQKDQQSRVASVASPTAGAKPTPPVAGAAGRAVAPVQVALRGTSARQQRAPALAAQPATPSPPPALALARLEHSAKGTEALGVLVQYLVFQLDGLNAPHWRRLATAERANALRSSQEVLEAREMRMKDHRTIADCLNKISKLESEVSEKNECNSRLLAAASEAEAKYKAAIEETSMLAKDVKGLKATIDDLKRDVSEGRLRLSKALEESRAATAAHEAAKREFAAALLRRAETSDASTNTDTQLVVTKSKVDGESPRRISNKSLDKLLSKDASSDAVTPSESSLAAEVRSLRAVLELKQAELGELRRAGAAAERADEQRAAAERRAARLAAHNEEMVARTEALQAEATALSKDNARLRETLAWEISQKNNMTKFVEQLRYKLRHNGEVVNLLVGQNGRRLNKSFPCGDEKIGRISPERRSPPESPRVKAVVEKQDSVSWVLEMDESPEEVASRLARRANSFRGSPGGPGSPASPASPSSQPLKRRDRNGSSSGVGPRSSCKLFRSGSAERGAWRPKEASSPFARRERAVSLSQEPRCRPDSVGLPSPPAGVALQESGGEAMISGSESDDERSAGGEPRDADSRTDSDLEADDPIVPRRLERPEGRGEVDPVLLKIAESIDKSLSATPMEVSWSEDGDCILVSETEI